MNAIRIGMVGLGGIARGVHLPGISKSKDMKLIAVCDMDGKKLREIGDEFGIDEARRFTDYRELIACPDVDAVDICTSNDAHFEIAMEAVRARKNYSVEKPITLDAKQADALAAATKNAGVKSMVCFSYRFKSAARYARDLIAQGVIGKVYQVDMQYYQAWGLPLFSTPCVWRFEKARSGSGALGDLGSHALDLVRFVTGLNCKKIVAHTGTFVKERARLDGDGMGAVDVDDFSNFFAELENGGAATFRITRFGYGRGNYQAMEIYGEKGALVYELDASGDGEDALKVCLEPLGNSNHRFIGVPIPEKYRADQMQSFADIINGTADGLAADIFDGQINMHAVDAIIESAQNGAWAEL